MAYSTSCILSLASYQVLDRTHLLVVVVDLWLLVIVGNDPRADEAIVHRRRLLFDHCLTICVLVTLGRDRMLAPNRAIFVDGLTTQPIYVLNLLG